MVWLGNFSNTRSEFLVGSRAAAPVLFDTLEAVGLDRWAEDSPPNDKLETVEVCAFSGHTPNEACRHTVEIDVPRRAVPTETCPYHVQVDVDVETGHSLSATCRQDFDYETRTYVELPAQVRRWMRERLGDVSEAPPMHPGCRASVDKSELRIASPPANQTLVLMSHIPTERQKVSLEAHAGSRFSDLSWFVDGRFLGRVPTGEALWWTPEPGEHEIVVMSADGGSDRRTLRVR